MDTLKFKAIEIQDDNGAFDYGGTVTVTKDVYNAIDIISKKTLMYKRDVVNRLLRFALEHIE